MRDFFLTGGNPDCDTDVADIDKVFELLANAYGWDKVARIISFSTLAPRAVTRKVFSIFNKIPLWEVGNICKLIPDLSNWNDLLNNVEYMNEMKKYPLEWSVIQRLQGNVTNTSMHAGGIIIWDKISDVLPVKCIHDMSGIRRKRVVCFDMDVLHELG